MKRVCSFKVKIFQKVRQILKKEFSLVHILHTYSKNKNLIQN